MCLINVAHEHLTIQTGKKSKPALINVIGPGAEGRRPTHRAEGRGPRKTNTPLKEHRCKFKIVKITDSKS